MTLNQLTTLWASQVAIVVKNLPADAGDIRDAGLIPMLERSPGGGHGNPLQYFCLENPMDRGAWWAAVCRVAESWAWLKQLSMHALSFNFLNSKLGLHKILQIRHLSNCCIVGGSSYYLVLHILHIVMAICWLFYLFIWLFWVLVAAYGI